MKINLGTQNNEIIIEGDEDKAFFEIVFRYAHIKACEICIKDNQNFEIMKALYEDFIPKLEKLRSVLNDNNTQSVTVTENNFSVLI